MKNAFFTPEGFYRTAGYSVKWLYGLAAVCAAVAFYLGFFVCPIDATQGNSYRIIFIHVASAWDEHAHLCCDGGLFRCGACDQQQDVLDFLGRVAPTGA